MFILFLFSVVWIERGVDVAKTALVVSLFRSWFEYVAWVLRMNMEGQYGILLAVGAIALNILASSGAACWDRMVTART